MSSVPQRLKIDQLKIDQSPWLYGQKIQLIGDNPTFYRFVRQKNGFFEFIQDSLFVAMSNKKRKPKKDLLDIQLFRQEINHFKIRKGCCKCGYNAHSKALHFDHIDPENKSNCISNLIATYERAGKKRREQIKELVILEMNKCSILCANCHAIKTSENKCGHQKLMKFYSSGEQYMADNGKDDKTYLLINPDSILK